MSETKLLPCPFCGEPAETDMSRGYRALGSGKAGNAVAVYCSKCTADMTLCCEDYPGDPPEYLLGLLVEQWNTRTPHTVDL